MIFEELRIRVQLRICLALINTMQNETLFRPISNKVIVCSCNVNSNVVFVVFIDFAKGQYFNSYEIAFV